jgi:hypothetical protein
MAHKLSFQKPLFQQKWSKSGPLNNFRWVGNYIFENYSRNGIKQHKKCCAKNLLLQAPQKDFTFSNFYWFAPYQGRPPEPLRVLSRFTCGNSSQCT